MLWCKCLIALAFLATSVHAAIWPSQAGEYTRDAVSRPDLSDKSVWEEYQLEEAERAEFVRGGTRFTAVAYRMADSTGAVAAEQWLQDGSPNSGVIQRRGNYVVQVDGPVGQARIALKSLLPALPDVRNASAPNLPLYLPKRSLIVGSEVYVLGPASLSRFEPRISADLAAFQFGTEGQLARYSTKAGAEASLIVFSYPTPQIAMDRLRAFTGLPGAVARRSGPLVSVVLGVEAAAADPILSQITYRAEVMENENVPKFENPGEMLQAIVLLAGFLMAASLVIGLFFGSIRPLFVRAGLAAPADQSFTSLNLGK